MAFTAAELANIAAASLDFYVSAPDGVFMQTVQEKPLLSIMEGKKKSFPGGKGDISLPVQFAFGAGGVNDTLTGYTHNDIVNYFTPANITRAQYPWREHHIGMTLTYTELKIDGISVTDDVTGDGASRHSQREMTALVNLLDNKMKDMAEQYARSLNLLLWGDGTIDPKALAGLRSIITDNPTVGTVGGINRALPANVGWRNRALTTANAGTAVTSNTANGGALLQVLQQEYRQLRRYGGNPTVFLAGSDFIDAMEVELRANGNYSQSGFTSSQDGSMGDLSFKGVKIKYDPTLDDLGRAKFGYWFDPRHIHLYCMENEWKRQHTPPRPSNQYALYKALTNTGQLVASQCNSALVIEIN